MWWLKGQRREWRGIARARIRGARRRRWFVMTSKSSALPITRTIGRTCKHTKAAWEVREAWARERSGAETFGSRTADGHVEHADELWAWHRDDVELQRDADHEDEQIDRLHAHESSVGGSEGVDKRSGAETFESCERCKQRSARSFETCSAPSNLPVHGA